MKKPNASFSMKASKSFRRFGNFGCNSGNLNSAPGRSAPSKSDTRTRKARRSARTRFRYGLRFQVLRCAVGTRPRRESFSKPRARRIPPTNTCGSPPYVKSARAETSSSPRARSRVHCKSAQRAVCSLPSPCDLRLARKGNRNLSTRCGGATTIRTSSPPSPFCSGPTANSTKPEAGGTAR